jgi:hypothetical protein
MTDTLELGRNRALLFANARRNGDRTVHPHGRRLHGVIDHTDPHLAEREPI